MSKSVIITHRENEVFHSEGPRPFFEYSELGISDATTGKAAAYHVRALREVRQGDGTGPHFHTADFQFLHILSGRALVNYEGRGPVEMRAGTTIFHPTGVRHDVLEVSADYEMVVFELPARYDTTPIEYV